MFLVKFFINLKPTVNDAQGQTIQGALRHLGFDKVDKVRVGKYMEISLNVENEDVASKMSKDMCEKLIANPVIEDYRFEVESMDV